MQERSTGVYCGVRDAPQAAADPRRRQGVRYPLPSVVMVALMAMVSGCDDAETMALWADHHERWLKRILDLPHWVEAPHAGRLPSGICGAVPSGVQ